MSSIRQPWHILLAALCGMVNQRQQQIIEFQNAPIDALLNKSGRKRLLLDDCQSHRICGIRSVNRSHFMPPHIEQTRPQLTRESMTATRARKSSMF